MVVINRNMRHFEARPMQPIRAAGTTIGHVHRLDVSHNLLVSAGARASNHAAASIAHGDAAGFSRVRP